MQNTEPSAAVLQEAQPSDLSRIENMMQFYNYELSEWYPIEFDTTGRYHVSSKTAYWANQRTQPFVIRVNAHLAGFAVVDDELVHPQSTYNLGYFFVARRYRHQGIGAAMLSALLRRCPGRWEVYHLAGNEAAGGFWPAALKKAGIASFATSNEVIHNEASVLYRFEAASET